MPTWCLDDEQIEGLRRSEWLNDNFINGAMTLLIKKSPVGVGGMFDVIYGANAEYPKADGDMWLQILHNGLNHWLLVAYGFPSLPKNCVVIFDSLRSEPSNLVLASCASLLGTSQDNFVLYSSSCQQQNNSDDCGVYAIAFATALLFNLDPSKVTFHSGKLRNHLKSCLLRRELTPFPSVGSRCANERESSETVVDVICSCRRPRRFLNS